MAWSPKNAAALCVTKRKKNRNLVAARYFKIKIIKLNKLQKNKSFTDLH